MSSRLLRLVLLISENECSLLPTVTARDWRSPGRQDHPRLLKTKGLPLPEVIGTRLTPEFCEWMMGFPEGWSERSE